jgi:hypothetical protein
MGRWQKKTPSPRRGPYDRDVYRWVPDYDGDMPTRSDISYLRHDLHGVEDNDFTIDDRAGMPKRPNTTGGGYKSGGDRQGVVFHKGKKPATKDYQEFKSNLDDKREYFSPERIEYDEDYVPVRAHSPGGREYRAGPTYGEMSMLHLTYEWSFGIDMYGTNMPNKSPLPDLKATEGQISLTPKIVEAWSCERKSQGANLKTVMSNLTAKQAAEQGGVVVTGEWAWLHLIAYTMGGQDNVNPDVPENLVTGTHESNIYHLAIESAVRKLVKEENRTLNVAWKLDGAIKKDWHIAERIIYTVSDPDPPHKSVAFTIHAWKHESGYGGDVSAIAAYLSVMLKKGT